METKTKIKAEEGRQELLVTREFDLPVELLYKAFEDPELIEQWMGTKVIKLENRKHGGYQFVTTDPKGNKHGFNGVYHEIVPDEKIVRTFEMESADFGPQLEFLEFEKLTDETSRLKMQIIYRSPELRDQQLRLPFAQGINFAHNRLQELMNRQK